MALSGTLVGQTKIEFHGDVLHELFRNEPHKISSMTPDHIQGCEVHEGEFGEVGSVLFWNYTLDGKEETLKCILVAIDEEKKSISFKVTEGDIVELYPTFVATLHVETDGDNHVAFWTLEYEKLNEDIPDPNNILEFAIKVTKGIETHHI